jgi:UDP:flavonoid glycosyltransferase YjiC (YdhE family)
MLGAFAAGLPQLLLPQGADQFTNAEVVLEAGAGARLLADEFSSDAITDTAKALLDNENARASAKRLADEIAAMPSPDEVVARIL